MRYGAEVVTFLFPSRLDLAANVDISFNGDFIDSITRLYLLVSTPF